MSKTGRPPSRSVFIGNIAYESTREQLLDIFSEVGPVVNMRIVTDRETGRPKGYAFCEYKDESSAQSAMRNLNGRELNGRSLRVDFADNADRDRPSGDQDDFGHRTGGRDDHHIMHQDHHSHHPQQQQQQQQHQQHFRHPQQHPSHQQQQQQQVKPVDPVMAALMQLPKNHLYEAAAQMKHLVMTNPERARQILSQNPTMALVMLHIQFLLGMVGQQWTPQQGNVAKPPELKQPSILGLPPPSLSGAGSGVGPIPIGGAASGVMGAPPGAPPPPSHHHPHHHPQMPMGGPLAHQPQTGGSAPFFGGHPGQNVPGPRHASGLPGQHPGSFQQGPLHHPAQGLHHGGGPHQPPFFGGSQHQQQPGPYARPPSSYPQQPQHRQQPPQSQQQHQMGMQLPKESFQEILQTIPQDTLTDILKVTPEQLQQLPPQERQQVMLIQHNMKIYAHELLGGQQ